MTAMRILAYITPNDDPFAVRNALRAQGWTSVAMRAGWKWSANSRIETSWPTVYAPGYPGIARLYAEAGFSVVTDAINRADLPKPPVEIDTLPVSDVATVLCPGQYLRDELVNWIPQGVTIAVNEAARVYACDWQLCNDGFSDARFLGVQGSPGRATRRCHALSIPTGNWFALDRIGINDASWSVLCALRMAASMRAKTIFLVGHDLTVGNGVDGMTGHWPSGQLASVARETDLEINKLAEDGITVVRVRWINGAVRLEPDVVIKAPSVLDPGWTKAEEAAYSSATTEPPIVGDQPKLKKRGARRG